MLNSVISPTLLAAHALLMNSLSASSPTSALRFPLDKQPTKPTRTRILPLLKKHGRPADADDSSSCSTATDDEQNPAGKRQRRQAAATLVQNFPSWTGVGKKSKAQPRPAVHIPPRGIGPVTEPNQNDVLCGRGGRINSHEGNVQFRDIVSETKKGYLSKTTKKLEKAHIAAGVVQQIRNMEPPGRFLKEDAATGMWWDIGDAKAIKKVGQALREDAPDIREELGDDVDEINVDDGDKTVEKKAPSKIGSKDSPKTEKSISSSGSKKHVIVLPTTRSNKRGEDNSPGALPPQSSLKQPQLQPACGQPGIPGYQQVLPPSAASSVAAASITQVTLPSVGAQQAGMMYPPSAQSSNSSATLRHGQFSVRPQGAMSQKALEMMNQQQVQNATMMLGNGNVMGNGNVFGRAFVPPSEMSLGSHGSSVSGLSGFTNSQLLAETLLSGVSDGVSSLTAGDASYRMTLAAAAAHGLSPEQFQQLALMRQQQTINNMNKGGMGAPTAGMFQNHNGGNMGAGNSVFSGSRGSNGFNNYGMRSTLGSDLSGQTMPQAAAIFGGANSQNDVSNLLREDMSMAEHSLMGGGIRGSDASSFKQLSQQYAQQQLQQQLMLQQQAQQAQQAEQQARQQAQVQALRQQQQQQELLLREKQRLQLFEEQQHQHQQQLALQHADNSHFDGMDSSLMSGMSGFASLPSLQSRPLGNHKDGMDFSVFSGASLANSLANNTRTSGRPPYAPASSRYGSSGISVSGRSHASNYSIGAMSQSIASMSLHSGGASVASLSAQSAMSDFSDTLLALDLAETSSKYV